MASPKTIISLIAISVVFMYDEWVLTPSCEVVSGGHVAEDPEDLKVMVVANLLLLGSDSGFRNIYFRDYFLSKFFRRSFESFKPDMLLVLGDVSAKGYELTKRKWISVLQQLQRMLGPFLGLPFHVILGDRDVGECSGLNVESVNWIASKLPGLDSAGCGAFEISNISFVSLNAVALLCGNNDLRFSVERVIERESTDLQMEMEGKKGAFIESRKLSESSQTLGWRENSASSGSGPVLLLHFPLHPMANTNCRRVSVSKGTSISIESSRTSESGTLSGSGPYDLSRTLPPNATEYIFQALRPRIVFSAHTHEFCVYTHSDGTAEVTVPAMAWDARDDPGFIVAIFRRNKRMVTVSHCSLARESHVIIVHVSFLVFLILMLLANSSCRTSLRR